MPRISQRLTSVGVGAIVIVLQFVLFFSVGRGPITSNKLTNVFSLVRGPAPRNFPENDTSWNVQAPRPNDPRKAPQVLDERIVVAGHVLEHAPTKGAPRSLGIEPGDEHSMSRTPEFVVLFDQATSLAQARALIHLARPGANIPLSLSRPSKNFFGGAEVDRQFLVRVITKEPLIPTMSYVLTAGPHDEQADEDEIKRQSFRVVGPLHLEGIQCDQTGARQEDCAKVAGQVSLAGQAFTLDFNQRIAPNAGTSVRITPKVEQLSATAYRDTLRIAGAFAPSRRYALRIDAMQDAFGNSLSAPIALAIETPPLPASVAAPEGLMVLGERERRKFRVPTRNVKTLLLEAWPVDASDFGVLRTALEGVTKRVLPEGSPSVMKEVAVKARLNESVDAEMDLSSLLDESGAYLVAIHLKDEAFGAREVKYAEGSEASRQPVALIVSTVANTLATHVHRMRDASIIQVSNLMTGEPVIGARVVLPEGANGPLLTTDEMGVAVLRGATQPDLVRIERGVDFALMRLGPVTEILPGTSAYALASSTLFPTLSIGPTPHPLYRGYLFAERGVYRPGQIMHIKGTVQTQRGGLLNGVASTAFRIAMKGPDGKEMPVQSIQTSERGSFDLEVAAPSSLGGYALVLHKDADTVGVPIAEADVRVAEYEVPRFLVDIDHARVEEGQFRAVVRAKYGFGDPVVSGEISYRLRATDGVPKGGALSLAGLHFEPSGDGAKAWTSAGKAKLDAAGNFAIDVRLPTTKVVRSVQLEVDVADVSQRHIASHARTVQQASDSYAGVGIDKPWQDIGNPVAFVAGAVDVRGEVVEGVSIALELVHLTRRAITRRVAGALHTEWTSERKTTGRCAIVSAARPIGCSLVPRLPGEYEVVSTIKGLPGGSAQFFVRAHGVESNSDRGSPGDAHVATLVLDRKNYRSGEVAHIGLRNPFGEAVALLTLDQGGLIDHRAMLAKDALVVVDVPIAEHYAPWVNATVTLLPKGAGAPNDLRVGAIRIPVGLEDTTLAVEVLPDAQSYRPGAIAEMRIRVSRNQQPVADAEVTFAVVDEGVLRLTNEPLPDPVAWLHPGVPLSFSIFDDRLALAARTLSSHVAGDGSNRDELAERKKFSETAFFAASLLTDEHGVASARFTLPENLTEFRATAVALDREGRAGASKRSVVVTKPVKLVPVTPRFLLVGDTTELAAVVHNGSSSAIEARVQLNEKETKLTVLPGGEGRVVFPYKAETAGEKSFHWTLSDRDKVVDRVESKFNIQRSGMDQRPQIFGAFSGSHEVTIDVPEGAKSDPKGAVTIQVGALLWPEVASGLEYLLDYPHGCVEQTSSAMIALLAARTLLPRIGASTMTQSEIDLRINAGITRLAKMKVAEGGFGYWPDSRVSDAYGSAYALRTLAASERGGFQVAALVRSVVPYLQRVLDGDEHDQILKPLLARSLSEVGALKESSIDSLWDTRDKLTVAGLSNLAIALAKYPAQAPRVELILDHIEGSFDGDGNTLLDKKYSGGYYYGDTQDRAEATLALATLRPASSRLFAIASPLVPKRAKLFTTHNTALSVLALAELVRGAGVGGASGNVVELNGRPVIEARDLGLGSKEYVIPVAEIAGKRSTLVLRSNVTGQVSFTLQGRFQVPFESSASHAGRHEKSGPDLYRVYTDPAGKPIDIGNVHPGDLVRVTLVAKGINTEGYLALTDRVPAGFEPLEPDLTSVSITPLDESHPFAELLSHGVLATHVELHDDRVQIYFNGAIDDYAAATYVMRATTLGTYSAPPAHAEFMYTPQSSAYSEALTFIVK